MPILPHCALFGLSQTTLTLGRACCLADHPPLGLYDPDPQTALRGALFLGLSARQRPEQLLEQENPLGVALVGSDEGLEAAKRLPLLEGQPLLIISFFDAPGEPEGNHCRALVENLSALQDGAITATVPPLTFRLSGPEPARREAEAFLSAVSPDFQFSS